jgi:hypothetical protein
MRLVMNCGPVKNSWLAHMLAVSLPTMLPYHIQKPIQAVFLHTGFKSRYSIRVYFVESYTTSKFGLTFWRIYQVELHYLSQCLNWDGLKHTFLQVTRKTLPVIKRWAEVSTYLAGSTSWCFLNGFLHLRWVRTWFVQVSEQVSDAQSSLSILMPGAMSRRHPSLNLKHKMHHFFNFTLSWTNRNTFDCGLNM